MQGPNYCVITVDWRLSNQVIYFQAMANIRGLGRALAYSILKWNLGPRTIMVGHSLGAQTLGEAGRYYKTISGGKSLPLAHGLDPAGPGFDRCGSGVSLVPSDFDVVQVLHSNAQFNNLLVVVSGFGSSAKSGKCDFWLNGGFQQPGCETIGIQKLLEMSKNVATKNFANDVIQSQLEVAYCAHERSGEVYSSMLRGFCNFTGIECPNCGTVLSGKAPSGNQVPMMIGFDCPANKNYYVKSTNDFPAFCP